jgi:hypothetical protein
MAQKPKQPSIGNALFLGAMTIILAVILFYFFRSF